jgi:small subunit ribosomal protein S17
MKVKILSILDSKTIKALSTNYKKHYRYGKYVTSHKKYLVESFGKDVKIGDEVEIVESRPCSKTKKWALKISTKKQKLS